MNICPNCQTPYREQEKFCRHCGQPLPRDTSHGPAALPETPAEHGVGIRGEQVQVGRDVAGRDIVTVHQGLSPEASRRLLLTTVGLGLAIGMCLLLTATCFFSGGLILGGAVFAALNRPVESSPEAAQSMQQKLDAVNRLGSGSPFSVTFTEEEVNSYVNLVLGPQIGLSDGQVRFLKPGWLVLGGRWSGLWGRPVAAVLRFSQGDMPLQLESAAIRVFQIQGSDFGWVAIPTPLLRSLVAQVNAMLMENVRVDSFAVTPEGWEVGGIRR